MAGLPAAESQTAGPVPAADEKKRGLCTNVQPGVSHQAAVLLQRLSPNQGHHPWIQVRGRPSNHLSQLKSDFTALI